MEHRSTNLTQALIFLQDAVEKRLQNHFAKGKRILDITSLSLTLQDKEDSLYRLINHYKCTTPECVILLAALVPHVIPSFFDVLVTSHLTKGGDFIEFGGIKNEQRRTMMPTGETVLFLLAGNNVQNRMKYMNLFSTEHYFSKDHIVYLESVKSGEPLLSGKLVMDPEYIEMFTTGHLTVPKLSSAFPAKYITTGLGWDDLVLPDETLTEIKDLENWIKHNNTLMYDWGMYRKLKPGYRVLFYGPPGTGKTLTATLLGKHTDRPVFKIDLSMIVSKYIGETEKNLANLFDKAQNKNWILFFDEADAIFGKRTNVRDAHDKYANQEVSYLLQRIEDFSGLVILATNFLSNIDDAFRRRFNSLVKFNMPSVSERKALWQKSFPEKIQFSSTYMLDTLSQYELSGGNIINAVQYASLQTIIKNSNEVMLEDALKGIEKEMIKEGKHFKKLESKTT